MKKVFVFISTLITFAASYAQYTGSTYHFNESSIKQYLKDNIGSLDPIEGIYYVLLDRSYEETEIAPDGNKYNGDEGSINFSYRCAIVRISDNSFKIIDNSTIVGLHYEENTVKRIGETLTYSVTMEYNSTGVGYLQGVGECRRNFDGQISLESLNGFSFIIKAFAWRDIPRVIGGREYPDYFLTDYYDKYNFTKEYPTTSMYEEVIAKQEDESKSGEWTGTGYAIGNGYIVTNNHVADGAKSITIKGVKGDMNKGYDAEVVATDKTNDIAILKINDSRFNGFGVIPYCVSARMADVGEDIFVLGYPLTQALGNEIKLTNGIISSRTGYQGDVATYQMSAPVQPGNSGGPMFDSKGNVVGIVVAGVPGAENVGYAIKISYLKNLIESAGLNIRFPANNTVAGLSLAEKVKRVRNFVFYIECSDKETIHIETQPKQSKQVSTTQTNPQQKQVEQESSTKKKELQKGYVDLGLPSGTFWKSKNEEGFYTYDEAVSKYTDKLPSREQIKELKDKCKWTWTGSGYEVTGPNGISIILPAAGLKYCDGVIEDVGGYGFYWSSTEWSKDEAKHIYFNSNSVHIGDNYRCNGGSVRLVQN